MLANVNISEQDARTPDTKFGSQRPNFTLQPAFGVACAPALRQASSV